MAPRAPCVVRAANHYPEGAAEMSPYRRNVMVGATVLFALGVLGWMILQFGGRAVAPLAPARLSVKFTTDRADGLAEGSPLTFRGVNVGQITKVTRGDDGRTVLI